MPCRTYMAVAIAMLLASCSPGEPAGAGPRLSKWQEEAQRTANLRRAAREAERETRC